MADDLPPDIIQVISEKINSITDYINFRAVCKPWGSYSLPKPLHLPQQLPWLMIPFYPNPKDAKKKGSKPRKDNGVRLFYDLWQSKMHKLHLPETIGMMCGASYRGWVILVATEGTEVLLFNPITRARVQLPAFTTTLKILGYEENSIQSMVQTWCAREIGNYVISKLLFSTDLTDPNCVITVFLQRTCQIFFCRVGDPCWTLVNTYPVDIKTEKFAGATYHDGQFYLLFHEGVRIYDLHYPGKKVEFSFPPALRSAVKFMLEGKSGVYLVVFRKVEEDQEKREGNEPAAQEVQDDLSHYAVHAQEDQDDPSHDADGTDNCPGLKIGLYQIVRQRSVLQRVMDTSDTIIFYGDNYHFLAVGSDDWDSLAGDCMYIEHLCAPTAAKDEDESSYGIYFTKLGIIRSDLVVSDLGLGEHPPLWPAAPAMWFQPSFV